MERCNFCLKEVEFPDNDSGLCDHCNENKATKICPECRSEWCEKCTVGECLSCGCKLN